MLNDQKIVQEPPKLIKMTNTITSKKISKTEKIRRFHKLSGLFRKNIKAII